MLDVFRRFKSLRNLAIFIINLIPQSWEGEKLIKVIGHRGYVGGEWDQIGQLQFNFLKENGLTSSHCLLDIGCGALRGGVHFINYLEPGNYLGIDKEKMLIYLALKNELGDLIYKEKRPEFVISDCFEFHKFSRKPQFSLAKSLMTHLTPDDIRLCLSNLKSFVDKGHIFFASFFEGQSTFNRRSSHSIAMFKYSREKMEAFGEQTGWKAVYIGDWNQPRGQVMMKYELC